MSSSRKESESKVRIRTLSDTEIYPYYDDYLEKQNSASFFHTITYYNSLVKTPGIRAISIVVLDANDVIRAAAIGELTNEVRWLPFISKRLIFYAPPIFDSVEYLRIVLDQINRSKNGLFIQIRTLNGFTNDAIEVYKEYGYKLSDQLNAYITLKGKSETTVLAKFKNDKRKGIRKALEKYKLSVKEYDDVDFAINTFYNIQKKLYNRKRHSLKTRRYFYNLVNESNGKVRIAFALYKNVPIATQMYISYNKTITAFYTATLKDHLNKHAGDLLVWYLIQKGLKEKVSVFDFGGGGHPSKSYSPRVYKERFGTIFNNVGRLTKPNSLLYKMAMFIYYKILTKN